MNEKYKIKENESKDEYIYRICELKDSIGCWKDVRDIINEELDQDFSESAYRKKYQSFLKIFQSIKNNFESNCNEKQIDEKLIEIEKRTVRMRDTKNELNSSIRLEARFEDMIDNIVKSAELISKNKPYLEKEPILHCSDENKGILCIGDIHIGLDSKNRVNTFNTEIAIKKMNKLAINMIAHIKKEKLTTLYIINLGDNISNIIHTTLRLENRETVSEQLVIVAELISELIESIRPYCDVVYGSVHGNHDRITADKKESRNVDNYNFIIDWHLKTRFKNCNDVQFIKEKYSDGILLFSVNGHNICAVHGDKDKPEKIVADMILMNNTNFDLMLMGHRHSLALGEYHKRYVLQNPCFCGTDEYAFNIRKTSNPAQTLVIVSKENVIESIKTIKL